MELKLRPFQLFFWHNENLLETNLIIACKHALEIDWNKIIVERFHPTHFVSLINLKNEHEPWEYKK